MDIKGNFPKTFKYSGDGSWLRQTAVRLGGDIEVFGMDLTSHDELRVYIDPTFQPKNGLIYCDSGFLKSLRDELRLMGLDTDVDYSEAGMQGDDYVSFDVGTHFRDSLKGGR